MTFLEFLCCIKPKPKFLENYPIILDNYDFDGGFLVIDATS